MTLADVRPGQTVLILDIISDDVRSQALRLGIGVGQKAVCHTNIPKGPVVLGKSRQEIAIGRQLAHEIVIEVVAA
ncbi:MAG: ferrous iron transport protein A [Candidatus Sericytochromatia bacterium]|nr:ferrous iron transport protein A [Candidatus Sericytochromatia bacterium]